MYTSSKIELLPGLHIDRNAPQEVPLNEIQSNYRPTTAVYTSDAASGLMSTTPLISTEGSRVKPAISALSLAPAGVQNKNADPQEQRALERAKEYVERLTGGAGFNSKEASKSELEYPPLPDSSLPLSIFDRVSKNKRLEHLDVYLARYTSVRHSDDTQRNVEVRRVVSEIARMQPKLRSICHQLNRYLCELSNTNQEMKTHHKATLERQERDIYKRFESFFEDKIFAILREKREMEETIKKLKAEVMKLRKERDDELCQLKEELLRRLNVCERKEEEFSSFRQLIAAVFNTNGLLSKRVEDLEALLTRHRVQIPPSNADLHAFSTSAVSATKGGGAAQGGLDEAVVHYDAKQPIHQLFPDFMQASKEEMRLSRLTLQRELLTCAFDERSAYRLQITGLQNENVDLKLRITQLENTIRERDEYIYEKRFLGRCPRARAPPRTTALAHEELDTQRAEVSSEGEPLTPRPRDVPFALKTELGIDLNQSTNDIVLELAEVAVNLKHQLNTALVRLHQSTSVKEWMTEETMMEIDSERGGDRGGLLPTYPADQWNSLPHFLRTTIAPTTVNLRWRAADVAYLLHSFFTHFEALREAARGARDARMLAPRVLQQSERREALPVRLDATAEEMRRAPSEVPFGYVVSQFIRETLRGLGLGQKQAALAGRDPGRGPVVLPPSLAHGLVLPGTVQTTTAVGGGWPLAAEFTQFAYNLWWAVRRYRRTQPLCQLFLDVVDGVLPVEVFAVSDTVLGIVKDVFQRLDTDGTGMLSYWRLVGAVVKMTTDLHAQVARSGALMVVQTFRENECPLVGGRIPLAAVVADETNYDLHQQQRASSKPRSISAERNSEISRAKDSTGFSPTQKGSSVSLTGKKPPPNGASILLRFFRSLVLQRYASTYQMIEELLGPLVEESDVVFGLYVIPVSAIMRLVSRMKEEPTEDIDRELSTTFTQMDLQRIATLPAHAVFRGSHFADALNHATREANSDDDDTDRSSTIHKPRPTPFSQNYIDMVKERRIEERKHGGNHYALLASLIEEVLKCLPRLSRPVHFPFKQRLLPTPDQHSKQGDSGDTMSTGEPNARANGPKMVRRPPSRGSAPHSDSYPRRKQQKKINTTASTEKNPRKADEKVSKKKNAGSVLKTGSESGPTQTLITPSENSLKDLTMFVPIELMAMLRVEDQLVEWYGFCREMRKKVVPFTEKIFTPASVVEVSHAKLDP